MGVAAGTPRALTRPLPVEVPLRATLLFLLAAGVACRMRDAAPPSPPPAAPPADHHVHLVGADLLRDWRALGAEFSRPDSAYLSVVAALREGGSREALLVSMAHLYGTDEFRGGLGLSLAEEARRVAAVNAHIADEAARDTLRFVGFCSVHPLRPYALAELERCGRDGRARGIKLHLPSAGVDLAEAAHVARLAGIMALAAREQRPVLAHIGALNSTHADAFFERVVRPAGALRLVLAHGGGGGGTRAASRTVLRAATRYAEVAPAGTELFVELSAIALARETDGVPTAAPEELAAVGDELRAFGLGRVLYGSDYPAFRADEYWRDARRLLPFTAPEWAQVLANRLPR